MLAGLARSIIPKAPRAMTRNVNVVTGPALVHVSAAEKAILGAVMVCSWIAVPAWVLVNIKHYQGKSG